MVQNTTKKVLIKYIKIVSPKKMEISSSNIASPPDNKNSIIKNGQQIRAIFKMKIISGYHFFII